MILGIGVDIVDFVQLRQAIDRSGTPFLNRVFTLNERTNCLKRPNSIPCLAARFAAKEALAKALGIGIFKAGMQNMEVCNKKSGLPYFCIHGKLQTYLANLGDPAIHLSLSHGLFHATAFVVISKKAYLE